MSFTENLKDAKYALERELNSSVNGVQSLSCEPSPSLNTKSRKRTKNGYETINGVYKPFI